jgi:hypothetical protein
VEAGPDRYTRNGDGAEHAVGIVVCWGAARQAGEGRPAVRAFVWGKRIERRPTLAYGRWRTAVPER